MDRQKFDGVKRFLYGRWNRLVSLAKRRSIVLVSLAKQWSIVVRRAWVGALGLVAVTLLLTCIDQARDILTSIFNDLDLWLGQQSQQSEDFLWAGIVAYAAIWGSGLILAGILALIVRVTGPLEVVRRHLKEPGYDEKRYQVVSRRSSFVFIAALAVILIAYLVNISRNAGSVLLDMLIAAVSTAFISLIGLLPWLVKRPGYDEERRQAVSRYSCFVFIGTLVAIHTAYLVNMEGSTSSVFLDMFFAAVFMAVVSFIVLLPWLVSSVIALTPWKWRIPLAWKIGIGLVFAIAMVLSELHLSAEFTLIVSGITPVLAWITLRAWAAFRIRRQSLPVPDNLSTILLVIVFILLSLMLLCLAFLDPWPSVLIVWLFKVGSIPIAFVWLAWLASALACLVVARRYLLGLGSTLMALIVIGALFLHREKTGQEWHHLPHHNPPPAVAITPSGKQIAIHADGGGLRAALFTAEVLALADDMTCGDFGSHVFAASGVSGGSLGIATWAVMRAELRKLEKESHPLYASWERCKQQREQAGIKKGEPYPDNNNYPLWTLVRNTLLLDHLTPALASTLTTDFLRPRGDAQRGKALLDSWQMGALDALEVEVVQPVDRDTLGAFTVDLEESRAGFDSGGPILLFTATAVETGDRVVFSNANWYNPSNVPANIPIGVAALDSARFPLISPAGAISIDGELRHVVDGGYFDNSGAATLSDMLIKARLYGYLTGEVTVARINGNASDREQDKKCDDFYIGAAKKGWYFFKDELFSKKRKDLLAEARQAHSTGADTSYKGWSGIDTYVETRSAHAEEAVKNLNNLGLLDYNDYNIWHIADHIIAPPLWFDYLVRLDDLSLFDYNSRRIVDHIIPPLQLDYLVGFYGNCVETLTGNPSPEKTSVSSSPATWPPCLMLNDQLCTLAPLRAPLGWALSLRSGQKVDISAATAAQRLLQAIYQQ
ncbi:MAG: MFS transporter [Rhodanobacter sp.]|jgi:MFS family permease|nr:MFS transporter [Rhodanobacter sp.]